MRYYVYQLVDPRDGRPFYIGKGTGDRIKQHERDARLGKGKNTAKEGRIQEIWDAGLQVVRQVLSRHASEAEAYREERAQIAAHGLHSLTNLSPGGEPEALKSKRRAEWFIKSMLSRMDSFAGERKRMAESLIAEMREALALIDRQLGLMP